MHMRLPAGAGAALLCALALPRVHRAAAAVDWPELDPAAYLPHGGRLTGPPPPMCPPACVPPVPAAPRCTFVLAADTGTDIDDYNRTGHYLCAPSTAADNGRLVVFFTGTAPSDTTLLIQATAAFGFHAIGLSYNNLGAPNGFCDVSYPKNQFIADPMCEFNIEQERLFGGNQSAVLWSVAHRNPPNAYALVNETNSITNRLDKALRYATAHSSAGSPRWSSFLVPSRDGGSGEPAASEPDSTAAVPTAAAPSNGTTIAWSKLVLSGWSRGSAYPIHISKYYAVSRIVLFCGLEDYVGLRGPDAKPDPWMNTMVGKIARSAIWGVGGMHGGCCSNWMENWGPAGLGLLGQGYADTERGDVVGRKVGDVAAALKGARRVYLQGPKVGHGTPIYDRAIPRYTNASGGGTATGSVAGLPIYWPVWQYLFTSQIAPGSQLPPNASCCCAPSHYYPRDFTGPRGCNATACRHR